MNQAHDAVPERAGDVLATGMTVIRVLRSRCRRYPGQPRAHFDPARLQALADSIKAVGQKKPISVRPVTGDPDHDFEFIDGERRWLACGLAGVQTVLAIVKPVFDEEEQFEESAVSNFGSEPHTPLETARAMLRIRDSKRLAHLSATEKVKQVAAIFACAETWVYQNLALLRLHPVVQEMLEAPEEKQRLSVSAAIAISPLPHDQQLIVAQKALTEGLRINQVRQVAQAAGREVGVKIGIAKRRGPVNDYRMFQTYLTRLKEGDIFLEMPMEDFTNMFRNRDPQDRVNAIQELDRSIARLQKLKRSLERVIPLSR